MFCKPYEEKFKAKKYVTLDESNNYSEKQPIEDRLMFFKHFDDSKYSIKDFYKPSGNKDIDEFIESVLEALLFKMHTKNESDISKFYHCLPSSFTIGVC